MQQPEPAAGPNGNVNNAGSIKNPSNGGNSGNVTKAQVVSNLKISPTTIPEKASSSAVEAKAQIETILPVLATTQQLPQQQQQSPAAPSFANSSSINSKLDRFYLADQNNSWVFFNFRFLSFVFFFDKKYCFLL